MKFNEQLKNILTDLKELKGFKTNPSAEMFRTKLIEIIQSDILYDGMKEINLITLPIKRIIFNPTLEMLQNRHYYPSIEIKREKEDKNLVWNLKIPYNDFNKIGFEYRTLSKTSLNKKQFSDFILIRDYFLKRLHCPINKINFINNNIPKDQIGKTYLSPETLENEVLISFKEEYKKFYQY